MTDSENATLDYRQMANSGYSLAEVTTMKAAVLEGIERIAVREVPDPQIEEDELLVNVKSCAVCGSDVRIYHSGHSMVKPPQIVGHEIAGVVVEVGPGVADFQEGDRLTIAPSIPCGNCHFCKRGFYNICNNLIGIGHNYPGGFAEYMIIPAPALKAGNVLRIPANLSYDEGCISEPLACVINGQELSSIDQEDTLAVIGAGPIGCMHVALAKAQGINRVILSELSEQRLEIARGFAADVYIDASREDTVEKVLEVTEGIGADVVIVAAPSKTAQQQALEMVSKRGRINFFGGLPRTDSVIQIDSNIIHYKEILLHGAHGSTARQHKAALELFSTRKIDPSAFITHRFPLDRIEEAFNIVESAAGMKVVINPEER